ncbi:hypothetical protein Taro_039215 [Colocasia esculenta]|uniref:Uncharacterized protein n=1 Tax=Colocasia esculenta TaxID=4460 RepID=A0A843W8Q8_COLES|nr:hypothetical protein [Colocasia esculenta]
MELSTSACVLYAVVVRPVSYRMSGLALPCGRVVVVTTGKPWCDLTVSTLVPGSVDTSPVSRRSSCLTGTKLQAILSRGRTWESRGIPGEKVVVLGKGVDPIEEAQEKKDFWHFRCHQSRALPIEENLHRFPSRLLNSSVCKASSSKNTHSTST